MANNRFNKQVTPKGYKMGGRVSKMGGGMMKRPMYKDGSPKTKQEKNFKITKNNIGKIKEAIKKGRGEAFKGNVKPFKEGGSAKKSKKKPIRYVSEKAVLEAATEKNRNPMKDQRLDDSFKGKAVRFKKAMGGSLKPVQPNQKGLKKLPTEVRNKMGYMKKGGEVKKLMTPKERAEYVKKAKVSLGATAKSLMDKNQPKKRDRLFQKYGK